MKPKEFAFLTLAVVVGLVVWQYVQPFLQKQS